MGEKNKDLDNIKATLIIDVEYLVFPLPVLRSKKALSKISSGEMLQIRGVNPNLHKAFKAWCDRNFHSFMGETRSLGNTNIYIKKG